MNKERCPLAARKQKVREERQEYALPVHTPFQPDPTSKSENRGRGILDLNHDTWVGSS